VSWEGKGVEWKKDYKSIMTKRSVSTEQDVIADSKPTSVSNADKGILWMGRGTEIAGTKL